MKQILALIFVCTSPAMAECPTKDSLSGPGIILTQQNNTATIFQSSTAPYISWQRFQGNQFDFGGLLINGFYFGGRFDQSNVTTDQPVRGFGSLPSIEPLSRFEVTMNLGGAPAGRQATTTYIGGPQTSVTLSGCTYEVIDFEYRTEYSSSSGNSAGQWRYIPDLGISYSLAFPAVGISEYAP